jgi:hypothetical protein
MFRFFMILLALGPATITNAQLATETNYELGKKIIIECTTKPPENGFLNILWDTSDGLDVEQVDNKLHLWGNIGSYNVDAVVIPLRTITLEGQTFDVIAGPITRYDVNFNIGPGPGPGPDPPPPSDVPFPAPGLTVLIIKESQTTGQLTADQRAIFTSSRVLNFLNGACTKLSDNNPAFRLWDDDFGTGQLSGAPKTLQTAYKYFKDKVNKIPWVLISNGKTGYSGPLPKDIDSFIQLVEGYK